jgi:putative tryptophan/tyrosine transport system substrate-binding protein
VPEELDQAFAQARADGAAAGFVISDLSTISNREEIGAAALRAGLPLLVSNRSYLTGGALMSYGPDVADGFRRAAHQVVRAAQGEADLPVEQPLRIELVVDLRAARALGLSLPLETLARADEVIE